jgi:hypothetical protein
LQLLWPHGSGNHPSLCCMSWTPPSELNWLQHKTGHGWIITSTTSMHLHATSVIHCLALLIMRIGPSTQQKEGYLQGGDKIDVVVSLTHVRWVPCHHSMARPQVADGGNTLQVWRVAANILNKQSRAADKGWSSSLGLGVGLTTPHRKKQACYETEHEASELDGFLG